MKEDRKDGAFTRIMKRASNVLWGYITMCGAHLGIV